MQRGQTLEGGIPHPLFMTLPGRSDDIVNGHQDWKSPQEMGSGYWKGARVTLGQQCSSRVDNRELGPQVSQESAQTTAKPEPTACREKWRDKAGGFRRAEAEQPSGLLSGISYVRHREGRRDRDVAGHNQTVAALAPPGLAVPSWLVTIWPPVGLSPPAAHSPSGLCT